MANKPDVLEAVMSNTVFKKFDYDYGNRCQFLADLIKEYPLKPWHELSQLALDQYPVSSKVLQDRYLSFEFFEKVLNEWE